MLPGPLFGFADPTYHANVAIYRVLITHEHGGLSGGSLSERVGDHPRIEDILDGGRRLEGQLLAAFPTQVKGVPGMMLGD